MKRSVQKSKRSTAVIAIACAAIMAVTAILLTGAKDAAPNIEFGPATFNFSPQVGMTALLRLKNTGNAAAFWGFNSSWLAIENDDGWSTNYTRGLRFLEPGAQMEMLLFLPPGTKRWQVGCSVRAASIQQRVSFALRGKWDGKLRELAREFLPNRQGPDREISSPIFEAMNFVEVPNEVDPRDNPTEPAATAIPDVGTFDYSP
jgi:hypothetical protein